MLTERIQAQAIKDYLEGIKVTINAKSLTGVYLDCWNAIQDKRNKESKLEALGRALDVEKNPDNAKVYQLILSLKTDGLRLASLDEIKDSIAQIEWLWDGWIPRGLITILAAAPGTGKTGLMLDLSRRITSKGEYWPDGFKIKNTSGNVLYIDAEGAPEVIKERALAWKMNLKRFFLKWPQDGEIFDLGDERYQNLIYEWSYTTQPELILIDSFGSINTKGENNIEDVRRILSYLIMLARDSKCGLILSHHMRKKIGIVNQAIEISQDDLRGSSHIVASARSILGLSIIQTTQEFDPNGPRKLNAIKMTMGAFPKPLGYEIVPGFPNGYSLKWGDAPKAYKEPDKVDLCAEWLIDILQEKPLALKEIIDMGKDEDFSKGTIIRARKKYTDRFQNTKGKRDPSNTWTLANTKK